MKTEFILNVIEKFGEFSMEVLDIVLTTYPDSYKNARRKMFYGPFYKELFEKPPKLSYEEYKKKEKQRFYNLLSHLQRQGLVKKFNESKNSKWGITEKGKKKLKELKSKIESQLPTRTYKKEKDGKLKIIIFDIPEEEKRKRNWLRKNLIALGFSMLQKSVWISQNKLSKDFISDLKELDILSYIEIFSIDKKGTLEKNF